MEMSAVRAAGLLLIAALVVAAGICFQLAYRHLTTAVRLRRFDLAASAGDPTDEMIFHRRRGFILLRWGVVFSIAGGIAWMATAVIEYLNLKP